MTTTTLKLPDYAEVSAVLTYNPTTGIVTRLSNGMPVGYLTPRGYLRTRFKGLLYYVHRLAWLLYHHKPPEGFIDHVDGVGWHNAIDNLRDLTHEVNMQNQRRPRRTNKAGLLGVSTTRYGTFQAEIRCGTHRTYLGTFNTAQDAHQAYVEKKRQIHTGGTL